MKNYRPLALLAVAGMILERVVAIQIEGYLETSVSRSGSCPRVPEAGTPTFRGRGGSGLTF